MLPEEWPVRLSAERGGLASPAVAGSDRLSTARQDFFLPPAHRLTEQERALMTAILHRLVEEVSAEIQRQLPQEWLPANEDHRELIERLSQSGLLDIEGLMGLLLRRADEERIASAFSNRPGHRASSIIQPLVSGEDAEVAAAAMAVLIARGRRRDRFGQAVVELDDVPAGDAAALVHAVAVALGERKPAHVSNSDAERELCRAATALSGLHDPARSLDHLTGELVRLLEDRGWLNDDWTRRAVEAAEVHLLTHILARRAGINFSVAANELLSGDSRRIMLLLRVAEVPREVAGHLLAVLGDVLGLAVDPESLNLFSSYSKERVASARNRLGLDPNFKVALTALGHGHASL